MSLFSDIPFTQHSQSIITEAVQAIMQSTAPKESAAHYRDSARLHEVSIDWSRLSATNEGSGVVVTVPVVGDPLLFNLRVSTNQDPAPNARLKHGRHGLDIVVTYSVTQGERTILSAIDSFRKVVQQHIEFLNQFISKHNRSLDEEMDKTLRIRRQAVDEAARIAEIINSEQRALFD